MCYWLMVAGWQLPACGGLILRAPLYDRIPAAVRTGCPLAHRHCATPSSFAAAYYAGIHLSNWAGVSSVAKLDAARNVS